MPGGEPNLVTDDFTAHLTLEHRQQPRDSNAVLLLCNIIEKTRASTRTYCVSPSLDILSSLSIVIYYSYSYTVQLFNDALSDRQVTY